MIARRLARGLGIGAVLFVASCFDDVRKETIIIYCLDTNCPDAGFDRTPDAAVLPEAGGGDADAGGRDTETGGSEEDTDGGEVDARDGGTDGGGVDADAGGVDAGDGGAPDSATCSAPSVIPPGDQAQLDTSAGTCGMTFCQRTGAGPFALNYCCDLGMFAQCHVDNVNLNRFDADHEGKGVLEVAFCLSAPATRSMIHMWYGRYPFRKALPLMGTDAPDIALGPGCYVRYFSPRDVLCAAYDPRFPLPVSKPDNIPFPSKCIGPAPNFYTWRCDGGRWTVAGEECLFDYDNTSLWITVENCVGRSESTVSIQSVKLLSDDCACTSDAQCLGTGRPRCATAGLCTDKP